MEVGGASLSEEGEVGVVSLSVVEVGGLSFHQKMMKFVLSVCHEMLKLLLVRRDDNGGS